MGQLGSCARDWRSATAAGRGKAALDGGWLRLAKVADDGAFASGLLLASSLAVGGVNVGVASITDNAGDDSGQDEGFEQHGSRLENLGLKMLD